MWYWEFNGLYWVKDRRISKELIMEGCLIKIKVGKTWFIIEWHASFLLFSNTIVLGTNYYNTKI